MAARKRHRKSRPASSTGRLLLVLLLAVIVVAGYLAYVAWERERVGHRRPGAWVEDPTAGLVSEERILFGGVPRPRDTSERLSVTVLRRHAYMAGYSENRREPLWVAYRVYHNPTPFKLPRPASFMADPDTAVPVKESDYVRSGFDRGHMAPNAAIAECFGADAQRETFYMSNICPQSPALNQQVWVKLETAERRYADSVEELWVYTGPIFGDMNGSTTPRLASGVAVPTGFYKILVDEEGNVGGKGRIFAVIMPQDVKGTELPQEFLTSVDAVEARSGFDFLWKLDDATEGELEAGKWRMW